MEDVVGFGSMGLVEEEIRNFLNNEKNGANGTSRPTTLRIVYEEPS